MTNMHKDHIASCLCCKNLWVEDEEPGYSEFTPGSPASMYCVKRKAKFDLDDFRKAMKTAHDKARDCDSFEPKDDEE